MMDQAAFPSEQPGAVSAYLELVGGQADQPAIFPIHDELVIGRDPQDSLTSDRYFCVPEHTISRRHARIRRRGGSYFIEDLHSRNGTFVGGERLLPGAWHALRDGDEVGVSSVPMQFHSLIMPPRDTVPAVITGTVDATRFARAPDATQLPPAGFGDESNTVRRLRAMAQVSIALGVVKDRATLSEKIMNFIFELFPQAERAFILLRQSERDPPTPVAARRSDGTAVDLQQLHLSRTIVDEVVNKKQAILSVDTLGDRHFSAHDSIVAQAILSVMCVPLIVGEEVLGLIEVDTSSDPFAFNASDLEIMTGVCAETAVALKNFQLYSDIERLLDGFVRASVQAIEERDPVTAGHSFRVAGYAEGLAMAVDRSSATALQKLSFSRDQLREIRYAALLHDFGKVGVREHVLRKEKKLHQADMRQLESRFKYARACIECTAYRQLVEQHAEQDLDIARFRQERDLLADRLGIEFSRLDEFLNAIRQSNEPSISTTAAVAGLSAVCAHGFCDTQGNSQALLEEDELLALSVAKGCLTPDERRQIEAHVADSYSFLILIPWTRDLSGVPAIAHGHHEKLDGSGYPMGLQGAQISHQTRILTICDIYDALTASDRPYKPAVPATLALDMLRAECQSGHLDADLFDAFVESKAWAGSGAAPAFAI
jgi:HD-GYP domain-containing protein (c-di-GMP phosphodiesterase class II)